MTDDRQGDDPQGSDSTGDPQLDRQVADLERSGEKVADRIKETRSDWESKKDDPSVPGAMEDPTTQDGSSDEDVDSVEKADDPYEWVDPAAASKDDGSDEDSSDQG